MNSGDRDAKILIEGIIELKSALETDLTDTVKRLVVIERLNNIIKRTF